MSVDQPAEEIILDACCVINLYGTGIPSDILSALPARFVIAKYVCEHEALYTVTDPSANQRERIDVNPLVARGLVSEVDLNLDTEASTLVEFASRLEAGEAATCTLALHRHFTVATDERKVLNLLKLRAPEIRTRTTTELIRWWADTTGTSNDRVRQVLMTIRSHARFAPGKLDPLKGWWDSLIGPG